MNTTSCQNTHITTVQILLLPHPHIFLSFPLLMLWVCIHTLPGSQDIQGDSGVGKCQGYFNQQFSLKKKKIYSINMDLIYKTSGVLLVEKKNVRACQNKGLSEYYKKIQCETEIRSCLMRDVSKPFVSFPTTQMPSSVQCCQSFHARTLQSHMVGLSKIYTKVNMKCFTKSPYFL